MLFCSRFLQAKNAVHVVVKRRHDRSFSVTARGWPGGVSSVSESAEASEKSSSVMLMRWWGWTRIIQGHAGPPTPVSRVTALASRPSLYPSNSTGVDLPLPPAGHGVEPFTCEYTAQQTTYSRYVQIVSHFAKVCQACRAVNGEMAYMVLCEQNLIHGVCSFQKRQRRFLNNVYTSSSFVPCTASLYQKSWNRPNQRQISQLYPNFLSQSANRPNTKPNGHSRPTYHFLRP